MIMRSGRLLLTALVTCAAALHAQIADTARANRMLNRLTAKLRADATLPDSLRRLSAAAFVSPANTNEAALLDDSTSSLLLRTFAATVHQVPESLCGSFLGGSPMPTGDLEIMLPYADSSTLNQWSTVLERIVRARAHPVSRRTPSDSVMKATFIGLYSRLGIPDQQRLMRIAQHPPPTPSDACWSIRVVMDGMAALPVQDAGPTVRAMFGQVSPRRQ